MAAVTGPDARAARRDGPVAAEALAAIGLLAVDGLGPARIRALVERYGSAVEALRAARSGALDPLLPPKLRARVRTARPADPREAAAGLGPGTRLIPFTSPDYPEGLRRLHHPPPVLWARGPLRADAARSVCIVGTRRATEYGRRAARRLAAGLAEAGWRIVSGLAHGVDAEAHRAALEAGGETVGVPGCGLRHAYPASSRPLYRALAARGLILTEFPPAEPPLPQNFPRRNRVLAGLSRAVVVVQAGARSGALITADEATAIGMDVLAVPGPIDLPVSEGVHDLLRSGAGVAADVRDVLDALGEPPSATRGTGASAPSDRAGAARPPDPDAGRILDGLRDGARHVDELCGATGLGIAATLSMLGRLEAAGTVRALPGGRYEAAG
ncbi:MAG: DNA-processing protein DprA [Gemmatimonadota bacterium]|nr:DNA-processing protein DprA [Gemmatimonadota bacterium]